MKDFSNILVESLAGKDKGKVFVVLKTVGDSHVLYADGRKRGVENPKMKKIKHIKALGGTAIADIDKATNGTLRKATAPYLKKSASRYMCSDQPANKEG